MFSESEGVAVFKFRQLTAKCKSNDAVRATSKELSDISFLIVLKSHQR
jgi:hypothetical protein